MSLRPDVFRLRSRIDQRSFADLGNLVEQCPGFCRASECGVEFASIAGDEGGCALLATAADVDRYRAGRPDGGGRILDRELFAAVAEGAVRIPDPGDYRQLVRQSLESLPNGGEWDAECVVLGLVPAGSDSQFHPPAADLRRRRRAALGAGRWRTSPG